MSLEREKACTCVRELYIWSVSLCLHEYTEPITPFLNSGPHLWGNIGTVSELYLFCSTFRANGDISVAFMVCFAALVCFLKTWLGRTQGLLPFLLSFLFFRSDRFTAYRSWCYYGERLSGKSLHLCDGGSFQWVLLCGRIIICNRWMKERCIWNTFVLVISVQFTQLLLWLLLYK